MTKKLVIRVTTLVVLCCLFLSPAHAVRTIGEHIGANDPAGEGFSGSGAGTSAVFGDMGFDAWNMTGPAGFSRYGFPLAAQDIVDMENTGWRMTANLRNTLAPDDSNDLGNIIEVSLANLGQWTMAIGSEGAGDPVVHAADLCCFGGTPIPLTGVSGSGYHEYQMLFNPSVSMTEVEVLVDGMSQGMMSQATNNFGDRFNWGNSDGGATHNTNWNLVRLETDIFLPIMPPVDPLVARHVGANDPTTEGFSGNGLGTSSVFNDMGFDAWNQTDPGGFARYGQAIPANQAVAMETDGFSAKAILRNLRTDDNAGDLGAVFEVSLPNLGQFTLFFGSDPIGNPTVLEADNCCTGGTPIVLDPSITGDGYHEFEMLYDPSVSATQAQLIVDGIPHGLFGPAANNFGTRVTWGASDSGASVDVNWNLVEVTVLPEPSCALLMLMGAVGLACVRRTSWRRD